MKAEHPPENEVRHNSFFLMVYTIKFAGQSLGDKSWQFLYFSD